MPDLSPELIAKIGVDASRMGRVAESLGSVTDPDEGREAMAGAADVLAELVPGSPLIHRLRDTSDLADSQVVGLCHEMGLSLARQAEALSGEVKRQSDQIEAAAPRRRWWQFWR